MKNRKDNYARAKSRFTNYQVTESTTLMEFLAQKMPEASRATLKNLLTRRLVHINGVITTQYNYPLESGMRVQISNDKNRMPFKSDLINIVHEDAYFIIIDKFAGTPSSPIRGRETKSSALYILENYIRKYNPRRKIYPIYKMDEEFSGLMVFAKDEQTKESFEDKWNTLVKNYAFLAICEGKPQKDSGLITSWMIDGQVYYAHSSMSSQQINKAETKYRVIKELPQHRFLIEFSPASPKANQIRLHAKELGCPIIGDKKFHPDSKSENLLAHAFKFDFIHPVTKEFIQIEKPLPNYMQALL